MERSHHLLVLMLGILVAAAGATVKRKTFLDLEKSSIVGTQPGQTALVSSSSYVPGNFIGTGCDPVSLAAQLSGNCVLPDVSNSRCCEVVVATVGMGGGFAPCLCRVALEPAFQAADFDIYAIITLYYTSCGGLRPGGLHLADACKGAFVPP